MQLQANQLREGDVVWMQRFGRRVRVRGVWGDAAGQVVVATDRTRYVFGPTDLVDVTLVGH